MKTVYNKEWILNKAKQGLFVDKYKYGHESLRKKCRRMCKDGELVMESQNKSGFYYKLP